jgi:arylsulfatase A-like enzyme
LSKRGALHRGDERVHPVQVLGHAHNGHERAADLKKTIDAPIAQLILDLEQRGLLDRTLIVLASEFSRDMVMEGRPGAVVKDQVVVPDLITEMKHYGMHRHFTDGCSVVMWGGGIKKGFLYGRTADERPCKTVEGKITIEDLHATIYRAMGISPQAQLRDREAAVLRDPRRRGRPAGRTVREGDLTARGIRPDRPPDSSSS